MITQTGKNLSILITTETGQDWQAFSTWYSIFKNLPEATIAVTCARNTETPFQYFQWAKKINLPVLKHDKFDPENPISTKLSSIRDALSANIVSTPLLIVDALVVFLDVLDQKLLDDFNSYEEIFDPNMWYLKNPNMSDMLNAVLLEDKFIKPQENRLCIEAKESQELSCVVSYKKGCGKWIDKLKGCPFSNANGLMTTEMTLNEIKVIDLWKKMCNLYSVVI